jgi:two-component system chemotaxis response regulator CheB
MKGEPIKPRVVVVDDSAASRAALAEILEKGGCQVVGRAMEGGQALRMVLDQDPDVVTCDLEMPNMDGFTFLRVLARQKPTPVVVVSTNDRPEATLLALELGARDFVVKPSARIRDFPAIGEELVKRVRALAEAHRSGGTPSVIAHSLPPPAPAPARRPVELLVMGASTGGPTALRELLGCLPHRDFPPTVIAQHMPPGFTEAFANRLARYLDLDVREAQDGARLRRGQVRVAPGGDHVVVRRDDQGNLVVRVIKSSEKDHVAPSIDRLFSSAAQVLGKKVMGIVLTGMGRDGAEGARDLAAVGASLWTEAAVTAVVDGMPLSAAAAHGDAVVYPLDRMGVHLSRFLQ